MSVRLLTILVGFVAAASALHAQPRFAAEPSPPYESDILSARPVRFTIGVLFGGYAFQHQGSYSPSCDCEFSGEKGTRVMFGGELAMQYPKLGFALRAQVYVHDFSAEFSREETRQSVTAGDDPDMSVLYRNTSNVSLRYLNIVPTFAYYLSKGDFFLYTGMEFGIPLEATYDHIERILTPGVAYYDGSTENVLLEESDIPSGKGLRLAIPLGLGYDWHIGPFLTVTPQAGVSLPLTPVSSQHSSWRVISEYGMLLLKLRL